MFLDKLLNIVSAQYTVGNISFAMVIDIIIIRSKSSVFRTYVHHGVLNFEPDAVILGM